MIPAQGRWQPDLEADVRIGRRLDQARDATVRWSFTLRPGTPGKGLPSLKSAPA
jgi:hypothetical protein